MIYETPSEKVLEQYEREILEPFRKKLPGLTKLELLAEWKMYHDYMKQATIAGQDCYLTRSVYHALRAEISMRNHIKGHVV